MMRFYKTAVTLMIIVLSSLTVINCGGEAEVKAIVETKIPVALDSVVYQPFQIDFHSIGRVVSENQVNLLFQSSGQVDSIWVNVGDYVEKGQRLASIDSDVYQTMYTQAKSM